MKAWMKTALCISLSFMCLFCCVGFAALSTELSVGGAADVTPVYPDVYITGITPAASAGVTVTGHVGTVMTAKVTGSGTATFTVNVKNISGTVYLFDRVIDGAEAAIEGAYAGTEITWELNGIAQKDEIAPDGGTLSFDVTITVPEGVTADYYILKFNFVDKFAIPEDYFPEEMPDGEISLVQRLSDILNNKYKTAIVTNSRSYLIDETIQVRWSEGAAPYVGSMDKDFAEQIDALFGDVLYDSTLSFLLKNEDLNWDGYNEIALYSTSDPLDSTSEWPSGVVCVYITVFTPVIDEQKNVIGYNMVCESLHGYAAEVRYGQNDLTPSFSTDHWRDNVGYWYYDEQTYQSYELPVPDDAIGIDGVTPFKKHFESYNTSYQYGEYYWGATTPYGNRLWQCLDGKIPWLG